jgi:hypothetical protein
MTANELKYNFLLKFDALFENAAPSYDDRQVSWLLTEAQWRIFLKKYNPFGNKYQVGFEGDERSRRGLEQLIKSCTISGTGVSAAITYTGTTIQGSKIVTSMSSIVGLVVGLPISGQGVPNGTIIEDIISNTSIKLSIAAASSGSQTYTSGLGKSTSQYGIHPNGVFLDLPDGFLYSIEESAITNLSTPKEVIIKPITHDQYTSNKDNPYKQPYKNLIWRMDISRAIQPIGTSTYSNKRTELILDDLSTLISYRTRYLSAPPAIVVDDITPTNQRHCILDDSIHSEVIDEAVVIAVAAVKPQEYQVSTAETQRNN